MIKVRSAHHLVRGACALANSRGWEGREECQMVSEEAKLWRKVC